MARYREPAAASSAAQLVYVCCRQLTKGRDPGCSEEASHLRADTVDFQEFAAGARCARRGAVRFAGQFVNRWRLGDLWFCDLWSCGLWFHSLCWGRGCIVRTHFSRRCRVGLGSGSGGHALYWRNVHCRIRHRLCRDCATRCRLFRAGVGPQLLPLVIGGCGSAGSHCRSTGGSAGGNTRQGQPSLDGSLRCRPHDRHQWCNGDCECTGRIANNPSMLLPPGTRNTTAAKWCIGYSRTRIDALSRSIDFSASLNLADRLMGSVCREDSPG